MSVDSSLDDSLDPSTSGSIPMDRLNQFLEEDTWYFSDEDSCSSGGSSDDDDVEPRVSDLEDSTEGHWAALCKSSAHGSNVTSTLDTATAGLNGSSSLEQSMGLQSVIDFFLAKLEPYAPAYDEEEATDAGAGGKGASRSSDTQLLLENGEDEKGGGGLEPQSQDSQQLVEEGGDTPVHPAGPTAVSPTPRIIQIGSEEEKDHAKLPPSVSTSKRPKYFFIANEILTSERTYVQGIRMVEKVLHGAVKTARDAGKPMIPESVRKRIFLNISEIHTLNTDFLDDLEKKLELWDTNPVVCDTLASRAPYFKLYSIYASKYEDSQVMFVEATKKYKPFSELVQHVENSNLCKGLPISSYMLYPIQRIPRYKLLLKDYLKHLPENHLDRNNTKEALKTISEVAQHLNDMIRDLEEQATLVKLQKLFAGKENLVLPGRKFLLRGPVHLLSGKKSNKKKERVLFLFSDVLFMTKISRRMKFKILIKFPLTDIQVSSMHSYSHENDFCIFLPTVSKPFRFCVRDRKERDIWVRYLRRYLAIELDKRKSFEKIKKSILLAPKGQVHVYQDPSFESRQPKITRKTYHPRRRLVVNPNNVAAATDGGGIEETDSADGGGTEETDSGMDDHFVMFEMEEMVEKEEDEFSALKPGQDNTLSSYMKYKREAGLTRGEGSSSSDGSSHNQSLWFVLTYTGLTGYSNHKSDDPCWALALSGCRMILSKQEPCTFKLITPEGGVYVFQLDNEYDYARWTRMLQEILNLDINKLYDSHF